MTGFPRRIYGTYAPDPEPLALKMGAISLLLEPHSGWVRHVRLNGEQELLLAIYPAVRDQNWNTIPAAISDFTLTQKRGGFQVTYHAECKEGDLHFVWEGEIVGEASGKLTYTFRGKALSSFLKNRIGLCILHPADCAGRACTVEHTDGATERGEFPKHISPHQPFKDIRAISQDVLWRVRATVRCEGDTFEMEDQRNWTDASFKTYSTPLDLPRPDHIEAGTEIVQTVTLTLSGAVSETNVTQRPTSIPVRSHGGAILGLPNLGLCLNLPSSPVSEQDEERLAALNLNHFRVDVDFTAANWQEKLEREAEFAASLGVGLEVALHLTQDFQAELNALAELSRRLPRRIVKHWLIFTNHAPVTPPEVLEAAIQTLNFSPVRQNFFAGTDAHFTELNRNRPENARYLCYSLNPQVHAFDTASLMETLPIQAETVRNARRLATQAVIAVTPVSLKARFNPNATAEEAASNADPRQYALCGAAWTVGSLKALAEEKTDSVTYGQTFGTAGILYHGENGSMASPIYHVLADIGEFRLGSMERLGWYDSEGKLAALLLGKRGRRRMLIANLTPHELPVEVEFAARRITLKMLDGMTDEQAVLAPEAWRATKGESLRGASIADSDARRIRLSLHPYAVARLDGEE